MRNKSQSPKQKFNIKFWKLGHLNFGIISDFDIWISNFLFSKDRLYKPFQILVGIVFNLYLSSFTFLDNLDFCS